MSKNKTVILINGTGGCGKDTFIYFCNEITRELSATLCYNVSTVDEVKRAAAILGWEGAKNDKDRKFLSDLKKLSALYSDHPYCYIREQIEMFQLNGMYSLMFFHSREPEEIKRFKEIGCITLLITNSNVGINESNKSDGEVLNFDYDYVIDNSGSQEELKCKAFEFITEILKSEL